MKGTIRRLGSCCAPRKISFLWSMLLLGWTINYSFRSTKFSYPNLLKSKGFLQTSFRMHKAHPLRPPYLSILGTLYPELSGPPKRLIYCQGIIHRCLGIADMRIWLFPVGVRRIILVPLCLRQAAVGRLPRAAASNAAASH